MSEYFDNKQLFSSPKVSQYGGHMVMTNVVKETRKKYINIDTKYCDEYSNNRLNTTSASNVIPSTYNIAKYTMTLSHKITDVKSISVKNAEIPNTFFNISAALGNNYFYISTSTGATVSTVITIPDGYYTSSNIAAAINAALPAYGGVNSVELQYSISNNFSQFTAVSSSGGASFNINFAVTPTGDFDKYNFKSKLGWLLGFRNTSYTVVKSSYTTSESMLNLNMKKYVYLAVEDFANAYQNSFLTSLPFSSINKNIIAKIQMDTSMWPFGYVQPINSNYGSLMSDTRTYNGKVDLQKLAVQLLDEDGNPVNLNGQDFSFGLEVVCE